MELKTVPLKKGVNVTFGQLTRDHIIAVVNATYDDARVEELRPAPVPGYTHQTALSAIKSYREGYAQYDAKIASTKMYNLVGAAFFAGQDSLAGDDPDEIPALLRLFSRLGMPHPVADDALSWGQAIYNVMAVLDVEESIFDWIMKGAGLTVNPEAVEAERKSETGDGERSTVGVSKRRNKAAADGRG